MSLSWYRVAIPTLNELIGKMISIKIYLFPVTQARKTKIPGKYPVIVGLCPAKISENGAIKAFKKTQKDAKSGGKGPIKR
jgi:hypothetical protein